MNLSDHPILKAARGERTEYTPIWIMRQAGRYSERYRKLREKAKDFMAFCKDPSLAAEATLIPILELDVDAAILFSDIFVPVEKMGVNVNFVKGVGPVLDRVESESDVERLKIPVPQSDLDYVLEEIHIIKRSLTDRPLIGFSGAPFTLACYLVEGKGSKDFSNVRAKFLSSPNFARKLMSKLTETVKLYLASQLEAGADLVQIFDSWMGVLSKDDYEEFVFPFMKEIVAYLKGRFPEKPVIVFGVSAFHLYESISKLGADVYGVDWRVSLSRASKALGDVLQGNLDPAVLLSDRELIKKRALAVLKSGINLKGHIFNLGHGILPQTSVENARYLVEIVHRESRALRA